MIALLLRVCSYCVRLGLSKVKTDTGSYGGEWLLFELCELLYRMWHYTLLYYIYHCFDCLVLLRCKLFNAEGYLLNITRPAPIMKIRCIS